jgi:hypothetical protein
LFRSVLPLLKRGGIALSKELAKGASGVLSDISDDINVNTAFKNRSGEVLQGLKRRAMSQMSGSGYKPAKRRKVSQSKVGRPKKRTIKKSTKKTVKRTKRKSTKKSKKSKKRSAAKGFDYFAH